MQKSFQFILTLLFSSLNSFASNPVILSNGNVSQGFIENIGQVKDQNGRRNEKVKFIYSSRYFNLELTNDGFSYEFFRVTDSPDNFPESGTLGLSESGRDKNSDVQTISSGRVDIILRNTRSHPEPVGEHDLGVSYNYYLNCLPAEGILNVRSYGKVVYRNIYPGIDMVFTIPDGNEPLKYEFIVHPGYDPGKIQLLYHGMDGMYINKDGDLQVETSLGFMRECDLMCYYLPGKTPVKSRFILKGNLASFDLPVSKDQMLIIDPNLVWGSYYGGENIEEVNAEIAVDKTGKPIIAGSTQSLSSIATTGAYQTIYRGGTDVCVCKFNLNGKISWATYFGGEAKDIAHGIASDKTSNIFITGKTKSTAYIATSGAYQTAYGGLGDGFVTKFNSSGILQWSTYIGGSFEEELKNTACDGTGNVYIAGLTNSPTGIATPGAYQENYAGSDDVLLSKFSAVGGLVWSTYYGGSLSDRAQGVVIDYQGNVIIAGSTASESGIATPGCFQHIYGGGASDAILAKFNAAGNLLWGTYYGGENDDHGRTPITDSSGNIYFTGFTTSATNIATPGSYQTQYSASGGVPANDAVVAKFNSSGDRIWASYYGGTNNDEFYSVAIGVQSVIYLAGATRSQDIISTADAFQSHLFSNSQDGLLVKMDSAGNRIWGSYFGGPENDQIGDIAISKTGFLYFVTNTEASMPCSPWVSQTHNNGQADLGAYKFYFGPGCYDYNEPNEALTSPTLLTVTSDSALYGYSGSISQSSDEDWFKFNVDAVTPDFKIELVDLTRDYDLQLFNANGVLLQSSNNLGTSDEIIILNNAPKKKYLLHVAHNSLQFDSLNCYRLLVFNNSNPFKEEDVHEKGAYEELVVMPNPVSNCLHLTFNSTSNGPMNIILYDLMMRPVIYRTEEAEEGKMNAEIFLPGLSSGPYILEIRKQEQIIRKKIIIQQ